MSSRVRRRLRKAFLASRLPFWRWRAFKRAYVLTGVVGLED